MNHTVTVIIPVLNAASMLQKVLQALNNQTYPKDLIEVLVVDNGSTDNSREVANSFGVKVLSETEKRSPYAARNLGFEHAGGTIIALTDANKVPDNHWIEEGVKPINRNEADLTGGQILFNMDENPASAELFDAITYNDNRKFILEQQSSASGNLFFKKKLLARLGPFPDQFRSGMDIWWTQNAVQKGYKLVFAEKAIVYCKPRKLKSLLKKSWRVGILHPIIFKQKGKSFIYILGQTFRTFAPPKIKPLKQKLFELEKQDSFFRVWGVAWMCRIMMGFGRIRGFTHLNQTIRGNTNSHTQN